MTDGILDLLSMILVLAIVVAIGFGLILPLVDTELMGYNEDINDKSIIVESKNNYTVGEKAGLSAEELVLISQVQDEGMPKPRTFSINNTMIEVESTYKLVVRNKGIELWNSIPDKNAKYTIGYDFGGKTGTWVETYRIQQK